MSETRALILGCGYVGLVLARRLVREGVTVAGSTRHPERREEIEAAGAEPLLLDAMDPASLARIPEWRPTVVFDLIRPQRIGVDRYTVWGTSNVASLLATLSLDAVVYLSSTSVYGRRSGEWTDESTPVDPSSPLGQARAESERVYFELQEKQGLPVRVCRVPGIYGPGRTLRQRLESGAYRRLDDGELWVSRIHVDDLAEGLVAAWRSGSPGQVYLLCDDEPLTSEAYVELTASLLALPLPPAVERNDIRDEVTGSVFERRIAARRCRNRRMREELKVHLIYPTVREGLPAALREEGAI